MKRKMKNLIRRYVPGTLYKTFFSHVDGKSKISSILAENWRNFRTDLRPLDGRMAVIENRGVEGMNSENIRFFINEAVKRFAKNGVYLEIGTFHGASLLSAALFNESTRCIGIDNFFEFNQEGKNEEILKENLEKFRCRNIEFYKSDYKKAIKELFLDGQKVSVYFYDGRHTFKDQFDGLEAILPYLAEKCVILIDDANMDSVERANNIFLKKNGDFKSVLKIKTKRNASNDWWNGFEVITRGI